MYQKLKLNKAHDENYSPWAKYRVSPARWDHTVLPATRHPTLVSVSKLVLDLPIPEGWKAELT